MDVGLEDPKDLKQLNKSHNEAHEHCRHFTPGVATDRTWSPAARGRSEAWPMATSTNRRSGTRGPARWRGGTEGDWGVREAREVSVNPIM